MSGVRIIPEDELGYARERVVSWCAKPYPNMTLGEVQHLAILIAVERQKAMALADPSPRRERRVCSPEGLPITLPAGAAAAAAGVDFENEVTEPRSTR